MLLGRHQLQRNDTELISKVLSLVFSHSPQLLTQGNVIFFHLTSVTSVQNGLLCAFHTCLDSEVDVQARQIYQEQEEHFPVCFEILSEQCQNESNIRRAAMCYFNSNQVVRGSVFKNLDQKTWPQGSESCIWGLFFFFFILMAI